MVACSCVGLKTVVARGVPFNQITDDATMFVPVTVRTRVACTWATVAVAGETVLTVGTGRELLQSGFSAEQLNRQKANIITRSKETRLRMGNGCLSGKQN